MKLRLCVKKRLSNYSGSYVRTILIVLSFLYSIFPYLLQKIVGDDFYIYSSYQSFTILYSLYFLLMLWLVFRALQMKVRKFESINCVHPTKKNIKFFWWMNFSYFGLIIIRGIFARIQGADRTFLLELISSQLFTGYGFILLLVCISVIWLREKKYLCYFVVICFLIDFIYQGKIFTTNVIMVVMFYLDDLRISISVKRLLLIGLLGFGFLFLIFAIRAITTGEESVFLSVYSLFSEFMGVNATVGWGYEYYLFNQPPSFVDFGSTLREYYIEEVGHGLALSPVAYFLANYGISYSYFISLFAYFGITYIFYVLSIRIIGRFALFVFMYNYIHLLRHGPDLFLSKSIFHICFLIALILLFNIYKEHNIIEYEKNRG